MTQDDCTCTPGTEDNGWHEGRCQICRDYELEQWGDMLRMLDIMKRTL